MKKKKNKKREYGKNRYHNMPEEKKQRLKEHQKEYQKNYHDAKERYSKEYQMSGYIKYLVVKTCLF